MNLSQHFDLREFTDSDTALRLGIDNDLPLTLVDVARGTAQLMERIRSVLMHASRRMCPVDVTSGYRCAKLNEAVGSKPSSDHLKMLAIDFKAPVFGTPLEICRVLVPVMDELGIGQLIYEHSWVHVSSRDPDKAFNRILTVQGSGYTTGIVEA